MEKEQRLSTDDRELFLASSAKPTVAPHHDSTDLGANLPAPLADPLRRLRTVLVWLNRLTTLVVVAVTVWEVTSGHYLAALFLGCLGLLGRVWLRGVAGLLPNSPTDILYLRSFRTDTETADIRTALERVMGEKQRISGIREPRRRWPMVLRFMTYLLFIFKYSHPKYMNLEAGDEWKGRLWRSLGEARGVVIDVADLTPAVEAEIRLCVHCVGLQRILFITRESLQPDIRQRLLELVDNLQSEAELHTAMWKHNEAPTSFEREVLSFANQLPDSKAGFALAARAFAEQLPDQQFRESNTLLVAEITIGLILGTALVAGFNQLQTVGPWGMLLWVSLSFVWSMVLGRQYTEFRKHCGSPNRIKLARRVILPVRLGAVVALVGTVVGLLLPEVRKVREVALRTESSSNLKQIGSAIHLHHDAFGWYPAANSTNPSITSSPYPVSWRVLLLPYLDHEDLFRRYRFDEPWDGPNNRELLSLMPDVYRRPTTDPSGVPEGHTFYRAFGSPPGQPANAAFIDYETLFLFSDFTDGMAQTPLVVESADAVPWTQPEYLNFYTGEDMPYLGKDYSGGARGVGANISTFLYPSDPTGEAIRANATPDGSEPSDGK